MLNKIEILSKTRESFEQNKFILGYYWKSENVSEIQKELHDRAWYSLPTPHTATRIRDMFEADGTVKNIYKQH